MLPVGSLISLSLIVLLTSSSSPAAEASQTVHLGYTNAQGAKVSVFLGEEQGIFRRHGIDLQLQRISPGTMGIPKLLSSDIQFFLGNSGPVVEAIAREQKELAIIANVGSDRFAIFARLPIRRIEDLRGKNFGVSTPGATQDRIARRALKKLGLDPDKDIRIVATGLNISVDRLKAMVRGEVDAVTASMEDFHELGEAKGGSVAKLVDLAEIGIYVSGADIATLRSYIRGHADTARRFLKALEESLQLARERPDLVGATYKKYLKIEDPQALEVRVKEYLASNPPRKPLPDKRAILGNLEELQERYPDLKLSDVSSYMDESLQ